MLYYDAFLLTYPKEISRDVGKCCLEGHRLQINKGVNNWNFTVQQQKFGKMYATSIYMMKYCACNKTGVEICKKYMGKCSP